jgi:hypothetical protein
MNQGKNYIKLGGSSHKLAGRRGFNVIPHSRTVQLSGNNRRWNWKRPRGVFIQMGEYQRQLPAFDITRIFQIIIYGLGLLLVSLGIRNLFNESGGEEFGNGF